MSSPITSPTLGTLPVELIENIVQYLSQSDIAQCAQVSRSWNTALTSFLWRRFAIDSHPRLEKIFTSEAWQALHRNTPHIRELHIHLDELYDRLFPPSSVIQSSDILGDENPYIFPTNLDILRLYPSELQVNRVSQGMVPFAQRNQGIRQLMLNIKIDPDIVLDLVTNHLPNLQDFHLAMAWEGDITTLLGNLPEGIRHIRLDEVYHTPSAEPGITPTVVKHHHCLQSLEIYNKYSGQAPELFIPFLESCSQNLQYLSGMDAKIYYHPKIVQTLNKIGFVWRVLKRDTLYHYEPDEDVAKVVSLSSQWTNIELYTETVGPMTMEAIADNCEQLETLKFVGNYIDGVRGSHLQAVLRKAPKLRSLEAPCPNDYDSMITTEDILSSEWASTSLEHLHLKILVPRTTYAFHDTIVQSTRDIQRQVLRRLGQQKRLRKLMFGGMVLSPSTWTYHLHSNCLEMTLESGLDELSGLKDLEELDIRRIDHHVGITELVWMAEHFPKLRRLQGVVDSYTTPSPDVLQWLRTHRPGWL